MANPWNKRRALDVFLDQSSLEVCAGLKDSLHSKLAGTRWLVLLLSETAATSRWVDEELTERGASRSTEHIALVLTSGEIHWNSASRNFDRERSTAVPEALRNLYDGRGGELLWLDLRWANEDRLAPDALDLRNTRFRDPVASLAAPIHGVPKDELEGEDVRQHRRSVRLRRAAIAGLAAVTVVALVLGGFARVRRDAANDQRDRARTAEAEATDLAEEVTARFLALSFEQTVDRSPELAAPLALQADRTRTNSETSGAMLGMVTSPWERTLTTGSISAVGFSPDGSRVMTGGDGGASVWGVDGSLEGVLTSDLVYSVGFSPDGTQIATGGEEGADLWSRDGGQPTQMTTGLVNSVVFASDGSHLATGGDGGAAVWGLDGTQEEILTSGQTYAIAFAPDGKHVATGGEDGAAVWGRLGTLQARLASGVVNSVAFSPDGTQIATAKDAGAELWSLEGSRELTLTTDFVDSVQFVPDGAQVVTGGKDVMVWSRDGRRCSALAIGPVNSVSFDPDGTSVAVGGADGAAL